MALVRSYYFSSEGSNTTPTSSDVSQATITTTNAGLPVASVSIMQFPLGLKDEFITALDRAEAEDASDGEVTGEYTLGDEGDFTDPFTFGVERDASGAITGIKMPSISSWSLAKARDFVVFLPDQAAAPAPPAPPPTPPAAPPAAP